MLHFYFQGCSPGVGCPNIGWRYRRDSDFSTVVKLLKNYKMADMGLVID